MARTADAVVVGGGIMGLLSARELRRAGLSVTLLERDRPGRQASWASAGIIVDRMADPMDPVDVLADLGRTMFPALAAELGEEAGLDVDYVQNGAIVPAIDEHVAAALERDTRALRAAGLACEFVTGTALRDAEPALGPRVLGARLLAGGNVEVRRLVRALEIADLRNGVEIVSGAPARRLIRSGGAVAGVATDAEEYAAPLVVIAAGGWSAQIEGADPAIPVGPQKGQILSLLPGPGGPRRVVLNPGDPYLVPRADGRLVVGATREMAGWDASPTAGGLAWLLTSAIELIPSLIDAPVHEQWIGFRPLSADRIPLIGPAALEGLHYITGHGPTGIAPAPASVALLMALIQDREPPVNPRPYDPLRFSGPR
ncbi:MAG TPA: FAD-dependent oxidoreductase [Candidatus Dormibacteraeota bacterium]|jgi:glycine oxidase|nr:FAD-dependent oxidoreductase [Candidatus Dormibacteraeota bacterium]